MQQQILIIGAGSSIAWAILEHWLADDSVATVNCVSRSPQPEALNHYRERLRWLHCDYTEASIDRVIAQLVAEKARFTTAFVCNGLLHNDSIHPEKRLEELHADQLQAVFQANAVVPLLWLGRLISVLAGKQRCQVVVFSARVGSIGDNRRGGWYSYRASKAALNMLVKTAAIEYSRRAPNVRFILFHPGTTDTPLSRPFQRAVPAGKLFTAEFVAERLWQLLSESADWQDPVFLDWSGQSIPW
ncbi:MAG: SDR family NAD(P)-dependent oxidoreductase [Gammaproteobacteria bacterium]|nr:SDR family NAD(P)-dependent oxidoreductase [Pseudomonadales bacterium]MCP5348700.1 SDR family NAD(P)-dependent oxidoreductase [Pseudomonadales bacterium]